MKKYWQNDKGYSLLLAIFAILIFSILGLSLIVLTSNGMAKNTNREEIIQATDLSEKGVDYIVKDIQNLIETEIKTNPMDKDEFSDFLDKTLGNNNLKCPSDGKVPHENIGIKIPGENGSSTKVCIEKIQYILTNGILEEKDKYKRLVTFKSFGLVNGKQHITSFDVIFGTDAVPDQLRYAISTNDNGNLYLHGGVEIHGDVKTDGNLILSNRATWISRTIDRDGRITNETVHWQPSVFTRILKDTKSATPKLIMPTTNKKIYILKDNKTPDYNQHISGNNFNNNYDSYDPTDTTAKILNNTFFSTKNLKLVSKDLPKDTLSVDAKVIEYSNGNANYSYKNNLEITTTNHATSNYKNTDTVYVTSTRTVKEKQTITEQEKYCKKSRKGRCQEWGTRTVTKTVDVNTVIDTPGNMTIDGDNGANNGNKTITLKGTYYINGDVTIKNVNLLADALIYVNGKVTITESIINGVKYNNSEEGTLLMFSTGEISISNISVDSNIENPSKIKGFFYSKDNFIMYGVGSNINLHGGISAKRIILTAVRGNTKNGYQSPQAQEVIEANVPKLDSRLKIIYDENLISNYTTFKRDEEEEFITQLNDPEMINRY